ncbi:hypothetical protein TOPH_04761 [Tolypocladium ophioglossoides CBS 100239]|uniref:Uncharacterized protein n=1 Tax=Tolypocladium ophioglossoides (strain CBS 100239) TaxID=1163406 RepID=A0A0L0N9W4_TOLOC|nr:hypothetical protein TOPH_04761 [Tolypocladium ophioglossoides CBS 100239]
MDELEENMGQWNLNSSSSSYDHHDAPSSSPNGSTGGHDSEDEPDLDGSEHGEHETDGMEDNEDDDDETSADLGNADSDSGVAETFSGHCIEICRPKYENFNGRIERKTERSDVSN